MQCIYIQFWLPVTAEHERYRLYTHTPDKHTFECIHVCMCNRIATRSNSTTNISSVNCLYLQYSTTHSLKHSSKARVVEWRYRQKSSWPTDAPTCTHSYTLELAVRDQKEFSILAKLSSLCIIWVYRERGKVDYVCECTILWVHTEID